MSKETTAADFQVDKDSDSDSDDGFFVIANEMLGQESQSQEPLSVLMVRSQMAMSQSSDSCAANNNGPTASTDHASGDEATNINSSECPGSAENSLKPEAEPEPEPEPVVPASSEVLEELDTVSHFASNFSAVSHEMSINLSKLVEENILLKNEVQATTSKLREAGSKFEAVLNSQKQRFAEFKKMEEENQLALTILNEEITTLRSMVEATTEENGQLRAENQNLNDEKQKEIDALTAQIDNMTAEMSQLRKEVEEAKVHRERQRQTDAELLQLKEKNAILKSKIGSMAGEVPQDKVQLELVAEKQREINDLQTTIENMALNLCLVQGQLDDAQLENESFKSKIQHLSAHNTEHRDYVKQLTAERSQREAELSRLLKENAELQLHIKCKDEDITDLMGQLDVVHVGLDEHTHAEMKSLKTKFKSSTQKLRAAAQKLEEQKQNETELLQFFESQLACKDVQLEEEKRVFQELTKFYEAEQDRTNELKKKVSDAVDDTAKLTEENQVLKSQIDFMEQVITELKNELEIQTTELHAREQEKSAASQELIELRVKLGAAENHLISEVESYKSQLENLHQDCEGLQELLNLEKRETEELKDEIRLAENARLLSTDISSENQKLLEELADSESQLHERLVEIDNLKSKLSDRDVEIETLRSQIQHVQSELDKNQKVLEEKDKTCHELKVQCATEVSQVHQLLADKQEAYDTLSEEFEAKEHLLGNVLEQLSRLETENSECNRYKEELIKKEVDLQDAILARTRCQDFVHKYQQKNKDLNDELTGYKVLLQRK